VTSAAQCGLDTVTSAARCGVDTVTSAAKCGFDFVSGLAEDLLSDFDLDSCSCSGFSPRCTCRTPATCRVPGTCDVPASCQVARTCTIERNCDPRRRSVTPLDARSGSATSDSLASEPHGPTIDAGGPHRRRRGACRTRRARPHRRVDRHRGALSGSSGDGDSNNHEPHRKSGLPAVPAGSWRQRVANQNEKDRLQPVIGRNRSSGNANFRDSRAGDRGRTGDLVLGKHTLWPTELHPRERGRNIPSDLGVST
jgi:hypothetical protein